MGEGLRSCWKRVEKVNVRRSFAMGTSSSKIMVAPILRVHVQIVEAVGRYQAGSTVMQINILFRRMVTSTLMNLVCGKYCSLPSGKLSDA